MSAQCQLSPKDLAVAIGTSESSLKRWTDEGRLSASRTAGGHRRIPLSEAVRFIRSSAIRAGRPELLGIRDLNSAVSAILASGRGEAALIDALREGREAEARGLIVGLFLASPSASEVCDGAVCNALHRIAEAIDRGEVQPQVADRSAAVCASGLLEAERLLPEPDALAPVALVETDAPWDSMVSLCLAEQGLRIVRTPDVAGSGSLVQRAAEHRARLIWLGTGEQEGHVRQTAEIERVASEASALGAVAAISDRFAHARSRSLRRIGSCAELASFVRASGLIHATGGSGPRSGFVPSMNGSTRGEFNGRLESHRPASRRGRRVAGR